MPKISKTTEKKAPKTKKETKVKEKPIKVLAEKKVKEPKAPKPVKVPVVKVPRTAAEEKLKLQIRKLVKKGKDNGYVTQDEIFKVFDKPEDHKFPNQFQLGTSKRSNLISGCLDECESQN